MQPIQPSLQWPQKRRNVLSECRNEKLKDRITTRDEHKCINCMIYNKHNHNRSISEDHSSLDRKYPSMQADCKIQTQYWLLNGIGKELQERDTQQSAYTDMLHANKPVALQSGEDNLMNVIHQDHRHFHPRTISLPKQNRNYKTTGPTHQMKIWTGQPSY